jgi:hypothetical protein
LLPEEVADTLRRQNLRVFGRESFLATGTRFGDENGEEAECNAE